MRDKVYIISDRHGALRMTKREPSLRRDEIAVALTITIPDASFRSPILNAALDVAESQTIQPTCEVEAEEQPEAPTLLAMHEGCDADR